MNPASRFRKNYDIEQSRKQTNGVLCMKHLLAVEQRLRDGPSQKFKLFDNDVLGPACVIPEARTLDLDDMRLGIFLFIFSACHNTRQSTRVSNPIKKKRSGNHKKIAGRQKWGFERLS